MIIGSNCLDSLPGDRDCIEYSQAVAKTPCSGEFPCLLLSDMDCLFSLFAGGKKTGSSVRADKF